MNKYLSRITSSARGEAFNPLTWPFLAATTAYGIGFTVFAGTSGVEASSLYQAMQSIHQVIPYIWGSVSVTVIIIGLTFLLFNIPPAGKVSGLIGFMVWVFASFCYVLTGGWLLLFSVALPNAYFWVWQYLSLSHFRHEDALDLNTMAAYDRGEYDNEESPIAAATERQHNRGVDLQ